VQCAARGPLRRMRGSFSVQGVARLSAGKDERSLSVQCFARGPLERMRGP
jgi:hypothetical protein